MDDELQFFQAWWMILKKYWNPPERHDQSEAAKEFWSRFCEECMELPGKYKDNKIFYPFTKKMCLELINEVQRRAVELHKEARC